MMNAQSFPRTQNAATVISKLGILVGLLLVVGLNSHLQAQSYYVLHGFTDGADGATPNAGLVVDSKGNLYGTTESGGTGGKGTVYKIDTHHIYSVVHSFSSNEGSDIRAGLRVDRAGNLYGAAWSSGGRGAGSLFKIDPNGKLRILHFFDNGTEGSHPWGTVIGDPEGNLYGTTWDGGNEITCHSCGVVYKLAPTGEYTVLHTFDGGTDGANLVAGLIRDSAGNLYGTTYQGGSGACNYQAGGCGILFRIDPSGTETILHTFVGSDGAAPYGSLVQDASGNIYGTTFSGGDSSCVQGCGVVFKFDTTGTFSILHSFSGNDGAGPLGDLILDAAGNLYGVTNRGGVADVGTVYRLTASGVYTLLYSFPKRPYGFHPGQVRLLRYKGGIYGTAANGGFGSGVVFKLVP